MKTRTEYEDTFKSSIKSNPFILAALTNGWSLQAILGVLIDRNNSMVNRVLELETKVTSNQHTPLP